MRLRYNLRNFNPSSKGISTRIVMLGNLIKSRSLVYVFVLVSLGTFLISSGLKIPDFFTVIKLVSSVYFVALATYLYNDLTDYNVDKINKRKILHSSKNLQYYTTLYSTIGFFVASFVLAFTINIETGLVDLIFFGLAIAYSHPAIHLKDRFILKTIVTAGGGCIASIMGSFAAGTPSYISVISSLIVFLFWFILGPLGDIDDIRGDKEGSRRTIPIVMGVEKTFLMMISVVSSIAFIVFLTHIFLGLNFIGMILGITVCIFAILKICSIFKLYEDKTKIKETRTILRYCIFTIQLMMFFGSVSSVVL